MSEQQSLPVPPPPRKKAQKPVKRTEGEMFGLLRKRYSEEHGNGEAWALIPAVRDAAGFNARRTIDAIAMSLWPSRGLRLHAFEIKCDRGDWLRELKNPAKAEHFCALCDHFWLVVGDESIVQDGELPPTWGLLVAKGNRLVQKVAAPLLGPSETGRKAAPLPEAFGRSFLAAMLRNACRQGAAAPEEIVAAREDAYAEAERCFGDEIDRLKDQVKQLQDRERRFVNEAGVDYFNWHGGQGVEQVARMLRAALAGDKDLQHLQQRVTRLATDARVLGEQADRILAEHTEGKPRMVA